MAFKTPLYGISHGRCDGCGMDGIGVHLTRLLPVLSPTSAVSCCSSGSSETCFDEDVVWFVVDADVLVRRGPCWMWSSVITASMVWILSLMSLAAGFGPKRRQCPGPSRVSYSGKLLGVDGPLQLPHVCGSPRQLCRGVPCVALRLA